MVESHPPPAPPLPQGGIYHMITDVSYGEVLLTPLLNVQSMSRQEIELSGFRDQLRKGRYKQKVRAQFQVIDLGSLLIPVNQVLALLMLKYTDILVFQHQAQPCCFDIYISHVQYCYHKKLDTAVRDFVINIVGGKSNLHSFTYTKNQNHSQGDFYTRGMFAKTGYEPSHQLIKYKQALTLVRNESVNVSSSQLTVSSDIVAVKSGNDAVSMMGSIIMVGNRIFDIQEFGRGCIKVMENLMFFTNNDFIRQLQLETNARKQQDTLRLLDHRPIIRDLWNETLEFALTRPGMDKIAQNFHQQQLAVLFNCNRQQIVNTFNQFALGNKGTIVQPHPVRALLDHIPYLEACKAFDICLYDFSQYGLNWIIAAYFVGKNFLTQDHHLTNNMGSVCFSGAPGSGKSRISSILLQFMNGFLFQDLGKGVAEFQNFDIVSKSFIKAEEVSLTRLSHADWKLLADLEQPIKCRVKNAADVEIGRFVPVVITSNGDVHGEIISKILNNLNSAAAHRRWAFIRYSCTWNQAHPEILEGMFERLSPTASVIYASNSINHELMNSLIGVALLFKNQQFVTCDYIISYYSHCLVKLSETLFGQLLLLNMNIFEGMSRLASNTYQQSDDKTCYKLQHQMGKQFADLCKEYLRKLINSFGAAQQHTYYLELVNESTDSLYYMCLSLTLDRDFNALIKAQGRQALQHFLTLNCAKNSLYPLILHELEFRELQCVSELLSPKSSSDSQGGSVVEQQQSNTCVELPDFFLLGIGEQQREQMIFD